MSSEAESALFGAFLSALWLWLSIAVFYYTHIHTQIHTRRHKRGTIIRESAPIDGAIIGTCCGGVCCTWTMLNICILFFVY